LNPKQAVAAAFKDHQLRKITVDNCAGMGRVTPLMKSDPLTGTLMGVLAVSVLLSGYFFTSYVTKTREIRASQITLMGINARRQAMTALVQDVMEYSTTHPAINPLLEAANLKPKSGAAPAPAARPATK
jgi:6-phosphofructokinase